MSIIFGFTLAVVCLVIFPLIKGGDAYFNGFGAEDRKDLFTKKHTKKSTVSAIRKSMILDFWDPDNITKSRRSAHRNKKHRLINLEPHQTLDHNENKRRGSRHEMSIYNNDLNQYSHKQNRLGSDNGEYYRPINPLVQYESQRYDVNDTNDIDPNNQTGNTDTNNDDETTNKHGNSMEPMLLNTNNGEELVKPLHKKEKDHRHRHHDVVNRVLKNAMDRYSPKTTKEIKTIATETECYDCDDADKRELEEDLQTILPFSKKSGYTGPPVNPINKEPTLSDVLKRYTDEGTRDEGTTDDHTFRAKTSKKKSNKSKKHSTTQSYSKLLRSGYKSKNVLRSTRMTPVPEESDKYKEKNKKEEKEKRQENKQKYSQDNYQEKKKGYTTDAKTDKGDFETIKKKFNAAYDNRFVLSAYAVEKQFKILLDQFPQASVESEILGRTVSYNDILLLKITKKENNFFRATDDVKYAKEGTAEKKIIFIVHALSCKGIKNLYSLRVETYLAKLLSYYLKHLDKFDIYLIPLGNPDGYSFVTNDSQEIPWNKNLSPQSDCPGVHLDRNFDVAWNSSQSKSSCDFDYPGPAPFSEPETRAVRDVLHKYSYKIVAYIHVHAGTFDLNVFKGDAVLYPKGYSDSTVDDDRYIDLKGEIDEAIKNANFKQLSVTVDTLHNWYGKVTGTSVDYASTVYGIPYSMEMVMQIYQDPLTVNAMRMSSGVLVELEYHALKQIWSRVIDVIFTNIYKKVQANDVEK